MPTPIGRTLLERWIYVLVKCDREFVVPYTPERWERVANDPAYGEDFASFLERVLEALAAADWAPGSYYPGGWYRMLQGKGGAPNRVDVTPEALRPFHMDELTVDRQGRWRVGSKPVSGKVLGYFLRNLHFDADLQRYVIRYPMEAHFETRYLHHRSPPIRVRRVTLGGEGITLRLNTGEEERLRPETLRMDADEQLYCAVRTERVPAWFEEPARWELLKDADEQDGTWVLRVDGRLLEATLDAPWAYADGLPA